MKKIPLIPIILSLRPKQWLKNALVFTAIIFNGQLFQPEYFAKSFWGFLVFCALSSSSYLFNDLLDYHYDQLHPQKKHRPLASGQLSRSIVKYTAIVLALTGLGFSLYLNGWLFVLGLIFLILHLAYSTILKKFAVLDILAISGSFVIRTLSGEVLTGYHLPVWLMLTVVFVALLIASGKRRSELISLGSKTRPALSFYRIQLLDVFNSTFATAALISYSLFTFFFQPPHFNPLLEKFLQVNFPQALGRKWLTLTLPFIIAAFMRYFQLIYEKNEGENPEKLLTSDHFLFFVVVGWGLMVILIIYVI